MRDAAARGGGIEDLGCGLILPACASMMDLAGRDEHVEARDAFGHRRAASPAPARCPALARATRDSATTRGLDDDGDAMSRTAWISPGETLRGIRPRSRRRRGPRAAARSAPSRRRSSCSPETARRRAMSCRRSEPSRIRPVPAVPVPWSVVLRLRGPVHGREKSEGRGAEPAAFCCCLRASLVGAARGLRCLFACSARSSAARRRPRTGS